MQIFSVSQLNANIKTILEGNFRQIVVEGEISGLNFYSSGHIYFSLKDANAQIKCVFWKFKNAPFRHLLKDGVKVKLTGTISFYEVRGDANFSIDRVELVGKGDLRVAFEELKLKLQKEGLFNQEHKQALPKIVKKIAVITSLNGAVLHDIKNTLSQRAKYVEIIILPVLVQGEIAINGIINALSEADKLNVDCIILARGGGSFEDLFIFNDERIVRTIFSLKTPLISSIGHETDFTLADFVADLRAATPTQATMLASFATVDLLQKIANLQYTAESYLLNKIENRQMTLSHLQTKLQANLPFNNKLHLIKNLKQQMQFAINKQLGYINHQLIICQEKLNLQNLQNKLDNKQQELSFKKQELNRVINLNLSTKANFLHTNKQQLIALSPSNVLNRGFAILINNKNEIISNIDMLQKGEMIKGVVASGEITLQVINKNGKRL